MKRYYVMLAVIVAIAVAAVASTVVAQAAGMQSLTGCRNVSTGIIDQVKVGSQPIGGTCGTGELKVTWNKTGPMGPQGPTGVTGAPGAPGVSGLEIVSVTSANNSIDNKQQTADCPPGKKVVGGGASTTYFQTPVGGSWPYADNRWSATASEMPATTLNWTLTVYAICVNALP